MVEEKGLVSGWSPPELVQAAPGKGVNALERRGGNLLTPHRMGLVLWCGPSVPAPVDRSAAAV